jgi:hypothetical protein
LNSDDFEKVNEILVYQRKRWAQEEAVAKQTTTQNL